jgi:formylglycine-generating enzyme required for sulfatase activity
MLFSAADVRLLETAMKSCPTCNRTFEDTMSFCLVDGSILSAPFDPNAHQHETIARPEAAPPTLRYSGTHPDEPSPPASVEPPLNTPPETIAAATIRSRIPVEGVINSDTDSLKRPETNQPTQGVPPAPAMKTIVAPPPEMVFEAQRGRGATPESSREPRQTIPAGRSQATAAPLAERGKPLRVFVIGALVVVTVLGAGIFWLIQHNKAANRAAKTAVDQPEKTAANKSISPATSFAESVNGSKIEMVAVKGGTFVMGSPTSDQGRDQDEGPQAEVTVQNFHMSKYEVTQAQYESVMNTNPSSFKGDDLPVDSVKWTDAVEFCRKLSKLTGHQYRLPTEAEWEYAARAGAKSSIDNVETVAWYDANSAGHPHPVGQKSANAFGLYDMNGNLWEWCQSKYKPYPYSATDGRENVEETDVRVLRGGSFESSARGCRPTYRRRVTPQPRTSGFRIVLIAQ